ncbi:MULTISPECIES: TRAP transporter large permease [Psychrobacillus]|uniref:TRAP transporter large permease n=1 Tax=Psychrobacillus faecigallinarum TaxID=2762235 RepID=A0ABR8R5P6_9BACI|nr:MULTISPECIES: TRAP transporter large permease [Psychrobacillus]MBD7943091.1 TRAP transporter large permease [Psychrobacillus faecigallinarum]QEY20545.1 TRAP transporter large permease [Psychrobacillus sp. AK 1817]QGM31081.1 TRAP transporter large permease subunit [Bacillus sp. N3536]
MTVALLFGTLFICLLIGVPIAISLGVSALVAIYFGSNLPLGIIAQKAFTSLDSFPLLAIPFFMLAGVLMSKGGVSKRLLDMAAALVGWIVGGLSLVTIVASMFFAAISGSGPATVAAIGGFMIPEMKKKKYDGGFAAAVSASAGSIGVIIPPSIPFVLYGVIGSVSVGSMFLAGILPGIIIGIGLMITAYFIAKKRGYKSEDNASFSFKDVLKATYDAKWALLIPIIILGGIYGGFFSPTEAAVVAVVYALIIGLFVYKELTWKSVFECFREAVVINATTMIIIGLSVSFAYFMTLEQVPNDISSFLTELSTNPIVILIAINIILLIVGMFIDTISALVILTPILLPIVIAVGVDPIHFGVILVTNLAIGFITPPLGVNLFVASSVGNVKFEKIVMAVIPFLFSMIVCLILITFLPSLSLWLPSILGNK